MKNDAHFNQYYDAIFILFKTGLRISELCGLTMADLNLSKKELTVDHQLQYINGKGKVISAPKTENGIRVLPLTDEVVDAFKRVLENRAKPLNEEVIDGYRGFIFLNHLDEASVGYYWEKKFKYSVEKYNKIYKEELPVITSHVARHTYCTRKVENGMSMASLSYLMGHSSMDVTYDIYTSKDTPEMKQSRHDEVQRIAELELDAKNDNIIYFGKQA